MKSLDERLRTIFARRPVARSCELVSAGVPRSIITRLVRSGRIQRIARGVYALPDYQEGEHAALLAVSRRAPEVVFCLLTALRFHELTTQSPGEVWIAIPNKARPPRLDYPPLRVVRYSDRSLHAGTMTRRIDGITITVTGIEKTVADCFKFRNKIGLDVAVEALREARASKEFDHDAFWRFAALLFKNQPVDPTQFGTLAAQAGVPGDAFAVEIGVPGGKPATLPQGSHALRGRLFLGTPLALAFQLPARRLRLRPALFRSGERADGAGCLPPDSLAGLVVPDEAGREPVQVPDIGAGFPAAAVSFHGNPVQPPIHDRQTADAETRAP